MSLHISNQELKERLHEIKTKLEVSENDMEIFSTVLKNDTGGVSIILQDEGAIRKSIQTIQDVSTLFLKNYAKGDYDIFKKYYKKDLNTWNFLTLDQKVLLNELNKLKLLSLKKYFSNRGHLMIFRKTINDFLETQIKGKEDIINIKEIRNYLINNYSYHDTLLGLGLSTEITDDGLVSLEFLKINDEGFLVSSV